MNPYEKHYRQLRAEGAAAWAGEGFPRAKAQQEKVFGWLHTQRYLPEPGSAVLELGCGNGAMAAQSLAESGYAVWGVDWSETAIRWAEERFDQAGLTGKFIVGDVCNIHSCADSMFELIIDGSCLHCLIDDARRRFYAEVKRLLRPGGRFVIGSMCGTPRYSEDRGTYDPRRHHLLKEGRPWRTLMPLTDLTDEIQSAQFSVEALTVNENEWWDHATIVCSVKQ